MTDDDEPTTDAERIVRIAALQNLTIAHAYNNAYGHYKGIEQIDGMKFYHCPDGSSIGTRPMPRKPDVEYHPVRHKNRGTILDIWTTPAK